MDIRLGDEEFINFMWDKYMLSKDKLQVQMRMQQLANQMVNKTFVPGPDKNMVGIINGHEKVSYVKDTIQSRWAKLTKRLRDIEREERGGFIIKMGKDNIKVE